MEKKQERSEASREEEEIELVEDRLTTKTEWFNNVLEELICTQ